MMRLKKTVLRYINNDEKKIEILPDTDMFVSARSLYRKFSGTG
jgi:hypothetical protein